jgi:hypothetical protein
VTGLLRGAARWLRWIAWPRVSWRDTPWPWKVFHVTVWVVVIALVSGGTWWGANAKVTHDDACQRHGVTHVMHEGAAGECVGVTDGSFLFDPQDPALTAVEKAIEQEDQRVTKPGSGYVSVAYLAPFSAAGGVEAIHTVAEQLEGAYAAQYYANRYNVEGKAPLIQLLIVNDGAQALQWPAAVDDINRVRASAHVVAVAGLGVSLDTTMSAVNKLTGNPDPLTKLPGDPDPLPVVGTVTADDFDNIPNMVRVSPSNQDAVSATLSFIKPKTSTALLIEDTNDHDTYDKALVKEFGSGFPDKTARHVILGVETYDTLNGDSPEVQNRIGQMTTNICSDKTNYVLFAGRGRDLATLLWALPTGTAWTNQSPSSPGSTSPTCRPAPRYARALPAG